LLEQPSVHPDHAGKSIAQVLKEAEGKAGGPITMTGFVRYALGDGIDKGEASDFAAEVASMAR
jgi:elongation factor Ts